MIQIQRHLIKPEYVEKFYMKTDENKSVKISKDKYLKMYDKSGRDNNIVVVAPITWE